MYILVLPRVGLYVDFLSLANARGKTSWHKGLPVVKTIYTYGFHELFLNFYMAKNRHFLSKWLYQDRKMSGHVMYMFVKGIDFVVTILRIIEHFYITK